MPDDANGNGKREAGKVEAQLAEIMRRLDRIEAKQDSMSECLTGMGVQYAGSAGRLAAVEKDVVAWDSHEHDQTYAFHDHTHSREWIAAIGAGVTALVAAVVALLN